MLKAPKKIFIKDRKGETKLEVDITVSARLLGHSYRKNKDRIYVKKNTKGLGSENEYFKDQQKDCDGYLYIKDGKTWSIECKYNAGGIKRHQYEAAHDINKTNNSHRFIIREVTESLDKKGTINIMHYVYRYLDNNLELVAEVGRSVDELIKWFEKQ